MSPARFTYQDSKYIARLLTVTGLLAIAALAPPGIALAAAGGLALMLVAIVAVDWERSRQLRRDLAECNDIGRALVLPAVRRRLNDSAGGVRGCSPQARGTGAEGLAPSVPGPSEPGRAPVFGAGFWWICPDHPEAAVDISITRERILTTCSVCARCHVEYKPSSPPPRPPDSPPASVNGLESDAGRGGGR